MKLIKYLLALAVSTLCMSTVCMADVVYYREAQTALSQNYILNSYESSRYDEVDILHNDYDDKVREESSWFFEDGQYTYQTVNEWGYHGTCSEAAEATVLNRIFRTNAYSENNLLRFSIALKQCITDGDIYSNGGQSAIQMCNVLNSVGVATGDYVKASYLVTSEVPDQKQCAELLEQGVNIIMGVDSYVLWDYTPEYISSIGIPEYYESNHWIVITEPKYDDEQNLIGFYIVDSSGYGKQYITTTDYQNMVFGPHNEIKYPACVCVTMPNKTLKMPASEADTESYMAASRIGDVAEYKKLPKSVRDYVNKHAIYFQYY